LLSEPNNRHLHQLHNLQELQTMYQFV